MLFKLRSPSSSNLDLKLLEYSRQVVNYCLLILKNPQPAAAAFSTKSISHGTFTYSNSTMTLVDASSFIDPSSAENLPSPGLPEQAQSPLYAASPSLFDYAGLTCNPVMEWEMSEEAETSVFHHLQRDSVNTELDMAEEMMKRNSQRSRMNFSGEEALLMTKHPYFLGPGSPTMNDSLPATNTGQCNTTMSVKVTYKTDTLRFPLSSSSTIKYLEEQLETKFKISLQNMSIKYLDEENEWITLMCDSGLMHGLDVLRSSGKTIIRMMVTPKFD